jgi:PAS domain S-box-containing protein
MAIEIQAETSDPAGPLDAVDGSRAGMARMIAEKDWSQTPLGPAAAWSDSLKQAVRFMLGSGYPIGIRWGPQLVAIYNDAYAPLLGEKHPAALGSPLREVYPEIYEELSAINLPILRGEGNGFYAKNHHWKLRRFGGVLEDAYFTISYSPILDPTAPNGIGGVLIITDETTHDVHRERKLQRLSERLEQQVAEQIRERDRIWQVSEDLLGVSNFEGYFPSVNPAWTAVLGWSADEIRCMHVSDLRHPDDAPDSLAQRERLARGVPTVRMENRFRHKDGSWRWIYWTLTADRGLIYVIGRHITADKKAAEKLRDRERQIRILVNAVTDYAIFQLDPNGIISTWNLGAERIKGYREDEIVGQHFSRFYMPEDQRDGLPAKALATARREGRREMEGWRVRKDGTRFWASVVIEAIHDEAGELTGFAKITRDITERRDNQLALQETQEQLAQAQKMDALGQLTGGIAHDFNNVLMVVSGYTQYLKRRVVDVKDKRAIEAIEIGTARAENLTRQLLTFARRQPLNPKTVKLAECLADFRDVLFASVARNVTIDIKMPSELWPVTVDVSEFEVAVINLLINARDAMPMGGVVRISGRNAALSGAERVANLKGDFVAVEVNDTGTGIPPEIIAKVFDPFFTTKEADKGTGLGLSQVYGFAHQAGGTVTIASKVGAGTTVTLYLPRAPKAADKAAQEKHSELPGGNETILLVEDNPDVQTIAATMLEELGYGVVTANSADRAMHILAERADIALVLSDVVMPGPFDGMALARRMRDDYRHIPVLLTTGYAKAVSEPFFEFPLLRKPYQMPALARAVRDVIDRRAPARAEQSEAGRA